MPQWEKYLWRAEGHRFESYIVHHTEKIRTYSQSGTGSDFLFSSKILHTEFMPPGFALRTTGGFVHSTKHSTFCTIFMTLIIPLFCGWSGIPWNLDTGMAAGWISAANWGLTPHWQKHSCGWDWTSYPSRPRRYFRCGNWFEDWIWANQKRSNSAKRIPQACLSDRGLALKEMVLSLRW